MNKKVEIDLEDYLSLVMDRDWLHALEAAGVDNWCGYGEAKEIFHEMCEVKDD